MVMGPENPDQIKEDVSERKVKEKQKGLMQRGLLSDMLTTLAAAGAFIIIAVIFGFIIHNIRY
ncbi:hypothetical protein SAMN05661091_5509 [Paenibacillus uliginis N3/975]|uniref:Uncharacterized protein n=1 Tax=Paenibacillus uliginis N3/975 TaxID=1313296 RepID=A0A1X7HRD6_9BACL|nr:hypothetical protein [Paenibacillus uliginis]SMF91605.1 hypothetical protein SAMN05661091_5509 [Paenibacillus uliginis N3/975]